MNINIKTIIIFLSSICFLATSCVDDILDKKPQDIFGDKDLWTSSKLVDAYVVNLYSSSRFGGILNDGESVSLITTSDEAINGMPHSGTHSINRGVLTASNDFNQYWDYELIRRINFFLENYSQSTLESEFLATRASEVRFLRAYAYFEMVKRYGGIPLITKVQNINEGDALFVLRNTEEEVYDFIISECQEAANGLPDFFYNIDEGRITKFVALSLLSRAAIYAASIAENGSPIIDPNGRVGIPSNKAKIYYTQSMEASDKIIESGKFNLYDKYADRAANYQNIFLDNQSNPEVIFWKKYVPKIAGHSYDWYQTKQKVTMAISAEMINSYEMLDHSDPVVDFVNAKGNLNTLLQKKDPRLHASVLWNGRVWRGAEIKSYKGVIDEINGQEVKMIDRNKDYKGMAQQGANFSENLATGFSVLKYLDPTVEVPLIGEGGTDYAVFRYAEILLNKAEAAFKLDKNSIATDALNEVRQRAGLQVLTSVNMAQIINERKVELAFEEHRYYDIRRWRIAEKEIAKDIHSVYAFYDFRISDYVYESFAAGNMTGSRKFLKQHYYLPIMPDKISKNPKLTENPGYK
ncbi:carbohydrate-binding protein [Bacteroidales bacterium]|nr:carbohydrate-binding protein [Bacteroidales bacterium]